MEIKQLTETAARILRPGMGILAADESSSTIKKRFDAVGVESTEENRRDYRELLFRTVEAMRNHISGVILFEETLRQNAGDGTPLVRLIEEAGSVPGIKVDKGAKPLALCPGETVTEGLDGLRERLQESYALGARFAKWRAVIHIGDNIPTSAAVGANAHALARYAALCQEQNVLPIVEPEVLMEGAHDIERCAEVTELVLRTVYHELYEQHVVFEGTILKPNMVVPGMAAPRQVGAEEVAEYTIRVLKRSVPAAVPGIAFLSGGQSEEEATAHLDAMSRMAGVPWRLTFSYGRALQASAQSAWRGIPENVPAAQRAFAHRARMNSLATLGRWTRDSEAAAA
jgi:fructose-bisphosphate aldolase class I